MFETSKDILLLVIAFCILWFTAFVCWLLYYFISIVGSTKKIVKSVQEKIDKVDELIELVKDKVNSSASYLPLIADGIGKIVKYFKSRNSDNEKNPSEVDKDFEEKKGK